MKRKLSLLFAILVLGSMAHGGPNPMSKRTSPTAVTVSVKSKPGTRPIVPGVRFAKFPPPPSGAAK